MKALFAASLVALCTGTAYAAPGAESDNTKNNLEQMGFQDSYSKTLTVCPSGCAYSKISDGFTAALNAAHKTLNHSIIVLKIADGTYTETNQIYNNDPLGSFVKIEGNVSQPSRVVVNFTNVRGTNFSGFITSNGGILGSLDGVTLNAIGAQATHTGQQTAWHEQSYGAGVSATSGGIIHLGRHVVINHFYYGVVADDGGVVEARDGGVTVTDAGDVAFMARGNGVISCPSCTARRASDMTSPDTARLGFCFDAERGGALHIDGSTCTGAAVGGVYALTNGKVWAHGVRISAPLTSQVIGIYALSGGAVEAQNSVISGMGTGINAHDTGFIECDACVVEASAGDNITADGGTFVGSGVKSTNAKNGWGFHAFHQGVMRLYGVLSRTQGNARGPFSAESAGSRNGMPYTASSLFVAD